MKNENDTLFIDFPNQSKIWLYQSDRALNEEEMNGLENELIHFADEWAAHGNKLAASAKVLNPYFLVMVVNDDLILPSGCSVDTKIKFIKELGQKLGVNFFDRMKVVIQEGVEQKQIPFSELGKYKDKLIYDPLITSLGVFRKQWPLPISESNFAHLV